MRPRLDEVEYLSLFAGTSSRNASDLATFYAYLATTNRLYADWLPCAHTDDHMTLHSLLIQQLLVSRAAIKQCIHIQPEWTFQGFVQIILKCFSVWHSFFTSLPSSVEIQPFLASKSKHMRTWWCFWIFNKATFFHSRSSCFSPAPVSGIQTEAFCFI